MEQIIIHLGPESITLWLKMFLIISLSTQHTNTNRHLLRSLYNKIKIKPNNFFFKYNKHKFDSGCDPDSLWQKYGMKIVVQF